MIERKNRLKYMLVFGMLITIIISVILIQRGQINKAQAQNGN